MFAEENMNLRKYLIAAHTAFVFAICTMPVAAQENKTVGNDIESKRSAAMKSIEFLHGKWSGRGWVMTREGRKESTITENFQPKLGGRIAVVDGFGASKDPRTGAEIPTHQAYGIFSYDPESDRIRFSNNRGKTGAEGAPDLEISGKTIVWGFDVPESGSKIKFTIRVDEKGIWREVGEFSRDQGKTWMKFMEMELSRLE